jgi:hypothetical protein
MTVLAQQTPTRIRILESCICSSRTTLPAGATLELLKGATWPPQVVRWLESGAIVALDPALSVPTLSRVGQEHFAAWFTEPPPPPAAEPPMTTADICKTFHWTADEFEFVRVHPSFPEAWFPETHILGTSVVTRRALRDAHKVREFMKTAGKIFGGR